MRKRPFEQGDVVRFVQMQPIEQSGTILKFCYRRCYSKTEKRTKLERTHALLLVEGQQIKVPYRHLK